MKPYLYAALRFVRRASSMVQDGQDFYHILLLCGSHGPIFLVQQSGGGLFSPIFSPGKSRLTSYSKLFYFIYDSILLLT